MIYSKTKNVKLASRDLVIFCCGGVGEYLSYSRIASGSMSF